MRLKAPIGIMHIGLWSWLQLLQVFGLVAQSEQILILYFLNVSILLHEELVLFVQAVLFEVDGF